MTFSTLIIGVAFLPLFTMTGVSGVIFSPMARTYAFAIGGAILLALTLTPVLASKFVPGACRGEGEHRRCACSTGSTAPLFDARAEAPEGARSRSSLVPIVLVRRPALRSSAASSCRSSRRATSGSARRCRRRSRSSSRRSTSVACARILRGCPRTRSDAVRRREPQAPRGRDGRLAARPPRRRHRRLRLLQHRALRAAQAVRRVAARRDQGEAHRRADRRSSTSAFPGVDLQLLADDLATTSKRRCPASRARTRSRCSAPISRSTRRRPTRSSTSMGKVARRQGPRACSTRSASPTCKITPDRDAVRALRAQHRRRRRGDPGGHRRPGGDAGLRGREALRSHGALDSRSTASSVEAIREITSRRPTAAQIPLGQLADDHRRRRARRSSTARTACRYAPVKFSVRGRDLGSTIAEAQAARSPTKVEARPTTRTSSGRARSTSSTRRWGASSIIIPLTLLLIAFLVYSAVKNWIDTLIVLIVDPGRVHRRHAARSCITRHQLLGVGGDGLHLDLRHRDPGRASSS